MKIYKKKELPRHEEEEFSVIVLTCDEHGETNLGFYNFDTEDWSFLSEADQSYRDSEFVWIYPPANQMKEFLIKSIKAERESAPPSSKENWFRKKTQPIKKKITLAFKSRSRYTAWSHSRLFPARESGSGCRTEVGGSLCNRLPVWHAVFLCQLHLVSRQPSG